MATFLGLDVAGVAESDGCVRLRFTPTAEHRGPAGRVHGGVLMAAADVAAAAACRQTGIKVVTARMDVRMARPVPLAPFEAEARIVRRRPRAVEVHLTISQPGDPRPLVTAHALMVEARP